MSRPAFDDAEGLSHVVGLRCGGFRWGRLPILGEIIFGPAPPPCGVVWLPGGAEGQAQGVGGLFARVGSPFSEPRDEYVHFSKTYL